VHLIFGHAQHRFTQRHSLEFLLQFGRDLTSRLSNLPKCRVVDDPHGQRVDHVPAAAGGAQLRRADCVRNQGNVTNDLALLPIAHGLVFVGLKIVARACNDGCDLVIVGGNVEVAASDEIESRAFLHQHELQIMILIVADSIAVGGLV
jgi:hypothetical protein